MAIHPKKIAETTQTPIQLAAAIVIVRRYDPQTHSSSNKRRTKNTANALSLCSYLMLLRPYISRRVVR